MSQIISPSNVSTIESSAAAKNCRPSKALSSPIFSPKQKTVGSPNRSAIDSDDNGVVHDGVGRRRDVDEVDGGGGGGDADMNSIDFDDLNSSSSILEFLSKEQECCMEEDAESIFQEVSRLTDNSDTRSVDELLREAELLIHKQPLIGARNKTNNNNKSNNNVKTQSSHKRSKNLNNLNPKYTKKVNNLNTSDAKKQPNASPENVVNGHHKDISILSMTSSAVCDNEDANNFNNFIENLPSDSLLSEESTPKGLKTITTTTGIQLKCDDDDTDDGTDTMEEITEGFARVELLRVSDTTNTANSAHTQQHTIYTNYVVDNDCDSTTLLQQLSSPLRRRSTQNCSAATHACSPEKLNQNYSSSNVGQHSAIIEPSALPTPDVVVSTRMQTTQTAARSYIDASPINDAATPPICYNKHTNTWSVPLANSATSPIDAISALTREHALKQDIDVLQEKLKDTEERLQSLRIQHDSLSQLHRDLRESSTHLQEQSELLKLDVQHLNECANVLRSELKASRHDRSEALELQKMLQSELEDARQEKRRAQEAHDKDSKTIQDLQRQCREMERILMRKHPDSVSALIVASKNPGKLLGSNEQENNTSRNLLEQRIAQLEADAKEQDKKAQQILANVQARFHSVQSKYETHIADLEMQVLSLQEINTRLNEKIESQVRTLDYFVSKKSEKYCNIATQTDSMSPKRLSTAKPSKYSAGNDDKSSTNNNHNKNTHTIATQTLKTNTRDHSTNTIAAPPSPATNSSHPQSASSSQSSTANSTPNNSRPNSKQSGLRKPAAHAATMLSSSLASKLPVSRSDSTISLSTSAKEDAHLLATIRGMRVDLAIKDKAMQRLSRELDECKKTIRKLQKDAAKMEKPPHVSASSSTSGNRCRVDYDGRTNYATDQKPANTENQALKEAQNKIKLLEADYKTLHDKRLQDLKTLQSAHEREMSSCHETVRLLQQRLSEREEAFAMQKRRKLPVDYYALKAKVSSLERRHSEREERLHLLVEALSKGRLGGALEELLSDNNNA